MDSSFTDIAKGIFGLTCHQDPSLLIYVDGKPLCLCPRCSGLHLGFFISFLAMILLFRRRLDLRNWRITSALIAAVILFAVDWGCGQLGVFEPSVASRMITGFALGGAAGILFAAYRDTYSDRASRFGKLTLARAVTLFGLTLLIGTVVLYAGNLAVITGILLVTVITNILLILQTAYWAVGKFRNPRFGKSL